MKTLITNILLLVACTAFAACGSYVNDLESYKNQYLEAWAKGMGTTKELLLKDLDISIDSMNIIPITVADSLAILDEVTKDNGKKLNELKTILNKIKQLQGLLAFSSDTEKIKETKTMLKELPLEITNIERALKEDYSRYKEMDKGIVLMNVFYCQATFLDSNSGVHKVEQRRALFTLNGTLEKFKCPMMLEAYLIDKK